VRLYSPEHGAVQLLARGLRKPGSKLAGQLKPGAELVFSSSPVRAGAPILTALSCRREHRRWQTELRLLALYWFMLECAWLASADDPGNADAYRLIVNLLRSEPQAEKFHSLASIFCLRFLGIHGLLPDLYHDEDSDEPLHGDCYCRPSFEGLLDAQRIASLSQPLSGLLHISVERLDRWRRLQGRPLLEYPEANCDAQDAAMLVSFARSQLASVAGSALRSAEFLLQQWKLASLREIMQRG
jgi:recombinational DNA repair protein (RecF pathway)